ncbi:putative nicotinate-nucleotide adenylyltransferase [Gossypium arboreum]|uniref:Putative nicotinate-nucleotide adenylyltransferase n=1 Tax=Gossypium arboreum TaxID=29729 RepID=A0A0B0NW00_GOSAR|nr:putative nicotinate-nucleotide adenylyltransferase [Gossypium arboreum]
MLASNRMHAHHFPSCGRICMSMLRPIIHLIPHKNSIHFTTNALHIVAQCTSLTYFIIESSSQANIHLEIVYMSYQYIMCKHISKAQILLTMQHA